MRGSKAAAHTAKHGNARVFSQVSKTRARRERARRKRVRKKRMRRRCQLTAAKMSDRTGGAAKRGCEVMSEYLF